MTLIELQHSIIIQSDVKADLGNRPSRADPLIWLSVVKKINVRPAAFLSGYAVQYIPRHKQRRNLVSDV
jgi:hypothetical protein